MWRLRERGTPRSRAGLARRLRLTFERLGSTYVKLGQIISAFEGLFPDELVDEFKRLRDQVPPERFHDIRALVERELGASLSDVFAEFDERPIAAASIAQVHKAVLVRESGERRTVAVKILRPGIKRRFFADLQSYRVVGRWAERLVPKTRRLRPTDVVDTLERSARLELDLRFEAAAISEFRENTKDDTGFVVPEISWDHTAESVLTTNWIEGIPIRELAALDAAGLDRRDLARRVMQAFLRHAIRDGYFHADMHPGNLFADPLTGDIIAVDFGIMGRIGRGERRFLADVVYGFITRDYRRMAERHFELGYVPADRSIEDFALALRAIGEPLHGRTANDISMARVLGQLFATTELFDMQTRPELVLLQKSMVLVEGVARALDPALDVWTIAEPVVGDWVRREAGPLGRIEDFADRLRTTGTAIGRLPAILERADRLLLEEEAERRAGRRPVPRLLVMAALWLAIATCLALLWRMLFA
jgi:ubiquinone biosynthesis protein